jgi:hypothetical protein
MFKNRKNAFWEAFVLTIIVFIVGILLGISYEASKFQEVTEFYDVSEISLMDAFALNNLVEGSEDCNVLINAHIDFADRIYQEAFLLEKYEDSGKLTESLRLAHRKYDLLRTLLWMNTEKTLNKCEQDFSLVVYLYEFETEDLVKKAEQNVWSRILFDLKQKQGNKLILIPIAVDSDLISLNSKLENYSISKYPVVIVNNEQIISELSSVEDIEKYLN